MAKPIPRAKIRGLLEALEREGKVYFRSGSVVEFEFCPGCGGTGQRPEPDFPLQDPAQATKSRSCEKCLGRKYRLLVTRPAGGQARFRLDHPGDVERAYRMALEGPERVPQPKSDKDWGPVPF